MPVHDWSRLDGWSFHDFHLSWCVELKKELNCRVLPTGYFAEIERAVSNRLTRRVAVRRDRDEVAVTYIEIASFANRQRLAGVERFASRLIAALRNGIHVLMVDILRPGRHTPLGMHPIVWREFEAEPAAPPAARPLTLATYTAAPRVELAQVDHIAIGDPMPYMALPLTAEQRVLVPLEAAYAEAWSGTRKSRRDALEAE